MSAFDPKRTSVALRWPFQRAGLGCYDTASRTSGEAMRRREVITLLAGAAVGWPLASAAQQRKVPTIGVLVVGSPGSEQFWQLFQKSMRELGYVEGKAFNTSFD